MKIEKINETQIRCTLTGEDLSDRNINLGELAYGSERAKDLFREMMQQAFQDFGFDVSDNALMVEAIPVSGDGIILLVTKVEDPEELDTRFSKFSPASEEDTSEDDLPLGLEGAEALKKKASDEPNAERTTAAPETKGSRKTPRIFEFRSLDVISRAAAIIAPHFDGSNSLYRDRDGKYLLVISPQGYPDESFAKVINILGEFGMPSRTGYAREAYLEEHCEKIIDGIALQIMKDL